MTDSNKKVMDSVNSKHEKIQVEVIGVYNKIKELEESGVRAAPLQKSAVSKAEESPTKTLSPEKSLESPAKPVEEFKAPEPVVEAPPKVPTPKASPEKPAEEPAQAEEPQADEPQADDPPMDDMDDDGGDIDFANLGGGGMTDEEKEEILGKLTDLQTQIDEIKEKGVKMLKT